MVSGKRAQINSENCFLSECYRFMGKENGLKNIDSPKSIDSPKHIDSTKVIDSPHLKIINLLSAN